jgi:pyrroloquinoline quinone biosynthesis protein B
VTVDGEAWLLLNCSPDIREQIGFVKRLQPQKSPRHSPIAHVLLTNADIDHIAGLLSLRESHAFALWARDKALELLAANSVFSVLGDLVSRHTLSIGQAVTPMAGLKVTAFEVPGKVPLYEEASLGHAVGRSGNTIGVHLEHEGKRLSYVPGCGEVDAQLLRDLAETDLLLFDGTLWRDDEMITAGIGEKTGRRMGHVPVSGADGSIKALETLRAARRYFVHMNNSNPLLVQGSIARLEAGASGWQVPSDGDEILL